MEQLEAFRRRDIPRFSPSPAPAPPPSAPATGSAAPVSSAPAFPALLLVGDEMATFAAGLRQGFRVTMADSVSAAVAAIERERPGLIVTELELKDGSGVAICEAAARFDPVATVLVTTADASQVPDAIAAGCASVLLKPYAANLLFSRVGRLARERARDLRLRANARVRGDDGTRPAGATNRTWVEARCPHCQAPNATSFEFVSHRRAWFACIGCRRVWIGRRLEDF